MLKLLKEMETYAESNFVPIARKANIDYLKEIIEKEKLYNILEIGTAIGYSAISLTSISKKIKLTSIEKDEKMVKIAKENIFKAGLEKQINLIEGDALEINITGSFDLIFIDGAKAQYKKFFEKFIPLLKDKGVVISDNLELLDLQRITQSKKSKKLVEKMKEYRKYLEKLEVYETTFLSIGDGFAVTRKNIETTNYN